MNSEIKTDNVNTVTGFAHNVEETMFSKTSVTSNLLPALPPGFYQIKWTNKGEVFYVKTDIPSLPEKIYGDTSEDCDRIINTFANRKSSTGVLLSGLKGSGKTLQAKLIVHKLSTLMPVFLVNASVPPTYIKTAVEEAQLCSVFVDEFEKLYPNDSDNDQVDFLALLDGTAKGKALYLLTVNTLNINSNLMNRPGRIFYHKMYEYLPFKFIVSYLEDKLDNKSFVADVAGRLFFSDSSFDIVQAVVEELNRYPELGLKALSLLNVDTASHYPDYLWRPNSSVKWLRLPPKNNSISCLVWPIWQILESIPSDMVDVYVKALGGVSSVVYDINKDNREYTELGCIVSNEFGELCITKSAHKQARLFDFHIHASPFEFWTDSDRALGGKRKVKKKKVIQSKNKPEAKAYKKKSALLAKLE